MMLPSNHPCLIISREFLPQDGGIAVAAFELANHLAMRGNPVYVLTFSYPPGLWPSAFKDTGQLFKLVRVKNSKYEFLNILSLFVEAVGIVKREKIKRIFATTWNYSGLVAAFLKIYFKIPFQVWAVGYEINPHALTMIHRILARWALRQAANVIAISRYTQDMVQKLCPHLKSSQFIPLGVNDQKYQPSVSAESVRKRYQLEGRKVLLTVARLVPRKGHQKVLEALPLILKKVPEAFYLIVGEGDERRMIMETLKRLHLEKNVAMAGFIQDEELPSFYSSCDVFILTNYEIKDPENYWKGDFEGFGLVFLEASATGKPVIGGRSGGVSDAVIENETGYLVDSMNTAEIAETVIALFQNQELAKKIGETGRRYAENIFSWRQVVDRYERLWSGV